MLVKVQPLLPLPLTTSNDDDGFLFTARDACHFKKEVGKCNGNFLRFYYDSVHDKCKKFLWTGCIGNGNRFFDYDSCNATCVGVHGEQKSLHLHILLNC